MSTHNIQFQNEKIPRDICFLEQSEEYSRDFKVRITHGKRATMFELSMFGYILLIAAQKHMLWAFIRNKKANGTALFSPKNVLS